jgi:hypothetical protein
VLGKALKDAKRGRIRSARRGPHATVGAHEQGYLSIIGSSWLLALGHHLSVLSQDKEWGRFGDLQVSPLENGHSGAAITITIGYLESLTARARIARPGSKDVVPYLESLGMRGIVLRDLDEAYVLRDVVLHDHVWEATYVELEDGPRVKRIWHVGGVKNSRWQRHVRGEARRTKRHRLWVVPTLVGRREAAFVLQAVVAAEAWLVKKNRIHPPRSHIGSLPLEEASARFSALTIQ